MKKNRLFKLCVVLSAISVLSVSAEVSVSEKNEYYKTVYVDSSKGGSGGNGTKQNPYRTISEAQAGIRKINGDMKGDIFVDIAPGEYFLSEKLVFTKEDSGTNGHDIIWSTTSAQKPLISGGRAVTGEWTVDDEEKNIYKVPLEADYVRQIYVDGVRAQRAKNEEYGILNAENTEVTDEGYITTNLEMQNWRNIGDVEMIYGELWTNSSCAALSKEMLEDGRLKIKMDNAMWSQVHILKGNGRVNLPWYIENAYELLDEEGEFYYDRAEKMLYYIPRSGENLKEAEVVVPYTEYAMDISGTVDEKITNIVFKNLNFSYFAWYQPDKLRGWTDSQNNIYYGGDGMYLPGAINVEYADYIDFIDCCIAHIGSAALVYRIGTHDCDLIGNEVYDIAAGGIHVGHAYSGLRYQGDLRTDIYNFNVTNNWVHHAAHSYRDGAGITIGYVSNSHFDHNEIGNLPYSGYHVSWGWDGAKVIGTGFRNVTIDNNYIYNTMHGTKINDGAAIYTLGQTGGSLDNFNSIKGNYIRQSESTSAAGGIYTDEGSSYWRVEDNVVDFYDAWKGPIASNLVYANVWTTSISFIRFINTYTTSNAIGIFNATESYEENTTVLGECEWDEKAKEIMANAGLESEYRAKMGGGKTSGFEKLILHNGEEKHIEDGTRKMRNMSLDVGEVRNFSYTAQNSWGEVVPESEYSVEFISLTPDIISVTNNSVTALKTGRGKMQFTVTYDGGKKQVREVSVFSGDTLSEVKYKDSTKKLLLDATLQIELECTSALGNGINEYTTSYTSTNPQIATVDAKGLIKAVGEGECDIITAVTADGVTVEALRTIKCERLGKFDSTGLKLTDISDVFNDKDNWYLRGKGNINSPRRNTMVIETPDGEAVYKGRTFENELLNFNVSITGPDTGWPTIAWSQQQPTGNPISNSDCYLIVVKPDVIELQRFNQGARTLFYGAVGVNIGKYGIMPNTYMRYGNEYNIQLGSIAQPDGTVRLIMNVNGYNVFDCIDDLDGRITNGGYFACINRDGGFTFSRQSDLSDTVNISSGSEFGDITYHWAKSYINKLKDKGYISGISETLFSPDTTITRAEFIAIISRILNIQGPQNISSFDDVEPDKWYQSAIEGGVEAGIIDAHFITGNSFRPDAPIRRDEMASLLALSYKYMNGEYYKATELDSFLDKDTVEAWAKPYMKVAVGSGLMFGDDTGNLRPQSTATRAEAAAMLLRFSELLES